MKLLIATLVLLTAASANAWWWGGYGYGMYGLYGMYGYGYPYYGYGYWGKRAADATVSQPPAALKNRTECVYLHEARSLSCRGLTGVVECETKCSPDGWEKEPVFSLYGLSRTTEGFYGIFARTPDNTKWLENLVQNTIDKKLIKVEVYYSADVEDRLWGLRVLDEKCYKKIDGLLQASLRNERVYYTTADGGEDITTLRADLVFARAPAVDATTTEGKEAVKRWWGGFYGGWYAPYYYGWYSPYYYYGKRSDGPTVELKSEGDFKREGETAVKRENHEEEDHEEEHHGEEDHEGGDHEEEEEEKTRSTHVW